QGQIYTFLRPAEFPKLSYSKSKQLMAEMGLKKIITPEGLKCLRQSFTTRAEPPRRAGHKKAAKVTRKKQKTNFNESNCLDRNKKIYGNRKLLTQSECSCLYIPSLYRARAFRSFLSIKLLYVDVAVKAVVTTIEATGFRTALTKFETSLIASFRHSFGRGNLKYWDEKSQHKLAGSCFPGGRSSGSVILGDDSYRRDWCMGR
ncbi:hypothetical protein AVEN_122696-1, partial [Araneus ventricosus]